jgi:hypothetical protein
MLASTLVIHLVVLNLEGELLVDETFVCLLTNSSVNAVRTLTRVGLIRTGSDHLHSGCGSQIAATGAQATDGCTMPCSKDGSTLCGGPNRVGTVFECSVIMLIASPAQHVQLHLYTSTRSH